MKIATLLNLIFFTLAIESSSGQCSLCPGGSGNIEDANYKIHDLADTCGTIDTRLSGVADGDCDTELASENFEFDFSAACCSDVDLSTISCTACPDGQFIYNPSVLIPEKGINLRRNESDC